MSDRQVIIVGGGQAGASAAFALAAGGLAGRVRLICAEDRLPYELPPLSKAVQVDDAPVLPLIRSAEEYATLGITLDLGKPATRIDATNNRIVLQDGAALSYDTLVIATGGVPRQLPRNVDPDGVVRYLRTFDDALTIRGRLRAGAKLLVIGAGVIGLELASSARKRGVEVTVLETGDRVMARCIGPEASAFLEALHHTRGVELRLGEGLASITSWAGRTEVVTTTGSTIVCDVVAAGIGMAPNLTLAESAGLDIDDGIVVDGHARTSDPNIYAVGDVARFPLKDRWIRLESWQHAQRHGEAAARAILGDTAVYSEIPWFWTDQHDVNVQVAGDVQHGDQTIVRDHGELGQTVLSISRQAVIGVTTLGRAGDMRPGLMLMSATGPIDAQQLGDPAYPLRNLAKDAGR